MLFDKKKLNVALDNIGSNYRKILLVNLTTDTFQPVTIADDEVPYIKGNKISEYWSWFANSEFVHEEDRQACLDYAVNVQPNTHLVYRRKLEGEWHWVLMELIPASDYSENNKACVCYVRDIQNIYQPEYEAIVERLGTKDEMTGLLNKVAFERDKTKHQDETVGLLFADINGLKYTNDNFGHAAGDKLIMQLASLLSINFDGYRCYHMSGDEFIVCAYGKSLHDFVRRSVSFHKSIWVGMDIPIASVGYSVGDAGEFQQAYEEAEKEMYDDKSIFYQKFPKYKRK